MMRANRVGWTLAFALAPVVAACSSPAPGNNTGNPFQNGSGGSSAGSTSTSTPTAGAGAGVGGSVSTAGSSTTVAGSGGSLGGSGGTASAAGSSGRGGSSGSAVGVGGSSGGAAGSGTGGTVSNEPPQPDARGIYGHPDPATEYPKYDGFTPYLIEEFNAPLDLDHDRNWTWSDGALGDGAARMVKENISFANGNMALTVTATPQTGAYSFAAADNVGARTLSSGELRTIYNDFRYGRYEVRMKAPVGASNYIFTMFAYRTPAYLNWREIDVEVQASPQSSFITNLITAKPDTRTWNAGIEEPARQFPFGGDAAAGPIPPGFDTQASYHVYAFEWLPTSVKWFVDGMLIRTKTGSAGANHLPIPELSTKIIMNLWIFPTKDLGGGDPALNKYPFSGQYDWFRFYKWNSDATYPCDNTPSCLTADDLKLSKNNAADPLPDLRPDMCTGFDGNRDQPCGN
jgi:beta-glucanase (GH16 family)